MRNIIVYGIFFVLLSCSNEKVKSTSLLDYPLTKTVPYVETIHGTEISDPYRWENGVTFQSLLNNSNGKIVLLDFETEWCGWCKKLDENTFSDK